MSRNCIKCCVNNRTGPDLLCDACRAKQQQAPDADGAGRKPVIVQSPYREIRTEHTFSRKEFTGDEPRPLCPGWNHGDGPPDWRNSGWGYDGVLYACTHDSPESAKLYRQLNHQYAIDFEVWALARLAAAEAKAKKAQETNNRLNRRCQEAEKALGDIRKFDLSQLKGGTIGRAFLAYGYARMREQLAAAEAARDAAVGIVSRLPTTADGVPIVPGMEVWTADPAIEQWFVRSVRFNPRAQYEPIFLSLMTRTTGEGSSAVPRETYSTREAALAALAAPPAVAAAAQDTTNGEANART